MSIRLADHVFTGVLNPGEHKASLIGQIHQTPKLSTAHLDYLLLTENAAVEDFVFLLEGLIKEAGFWGARQVLGEVQPENLFFEILRKSGFSVWAKQRIYTFHPPLNKKWALEKPWRIWTGADIPAMRGLYANLVPPLIQPIEPLTRRESLGLVHYNEDGSLQAYADLVYGPAGIWVLPFVHPKIVKDAADLFAQLLIDLPDAAGRPIYLAVRSYQPWIEGAAANLAEGALPEQALMVRHLALRQRVTVNLERASLENGTPEPTVPIAPIQIKENDL